MESAIRWLKASYLVGAVADGLVGVLMLLPSRMGETEFRYAMGLGAALMFGWTALLIWAWRKPMERRGVLALTIFPVISGLVASAVWAALAGQIPAERGVAAAALGAVLCLLFGFSYWKATRAERERTNR